MNTVVESAIEAGIAERLLPGGEALVRTAAGTCLVADAVPGDELELRLTERRRGAMRGTISRIAVPSVERVAPACAVAEACGGCALQYVRPAYQAAAKNDWVGRAFAPFIDGNTRFTGIDASDVTPGSRRRVRWRRGTDERGGYWGFRARASHDVVRHEACMTATPAIRALHAQLEDMPLPGVDAIQVAELADGLHLVLEGGGPIPELPDHVDRLPVQAWKRAGEGCVPLSRPVRTLHDRLPVGEAWIDIVVGPDDFMQASRAGNEAMIRQVQAWSDGARRVADLFSGFGNLSLPLAATGIRVVGAEVMAASVAAAT